MLFKAIAIFGSCGHFVQRSRTVCVLNWTISSKDFVKDISIILALVAILFS